MAKKTETALATVGAGAVTQLARLSADNYAIVAMANEGGGDVREALMENLGGSSLSAFDFQRVKVPAGGALAWSILNGDTGEETAETVFEGIIVAWNDQKAYWKVGLDAVGAVAGPPDCFSTDTVQGHGDPGVLCAHCPYNKFGTAKDGKARGKACKDVRLLFVCRPGDILPELVPAPPTSIKSVKAYFLRLAGRGIPYWRAVTRFKLVPDKNSAGTKYSKISLELVGIVDDAAMPAVKDYSATIRQMLGKATVQVRAADVAPSEAEDMPGGAAPSQHAHGSGSGEIIDADDDRSAQV
jgi:hypothetical protein